MKNKSQLTVFGLQSIWTGWVAQLVKNPPAMQETPVQFLGHRGIPTPVFLGFPGGSHGKESACNAGDLGSIPGLGKIPWKRARQPIPVFLPGESPRTEKPGGLQSMGLQRVGYDWAIKHSSAFLPVSDIND